MKFDPATKQAKGNFRSKSFDLKFMLEKIDGQPDCLPARDHNNGENQPPNFRCFLVHDDGQMVEMRSVWCRRTRDGAPWFDLEFDDPDFDKPLYLQAFCARGKDGKADIASNTYNVMWQRPAAQSSRAA